MVSPLDLADIQGNILFAYGKQGFPVGRLLLFNVSDAARGRDFVEAVRPMVTTALRWPSKVNPHHAASTTTVAKPAVALNIAFTFWGLVALKVSTRSLRGMPDEFIDGMYARAHILGDDVPTNCIDDWDPVWKLPRDGPAHRPHIMIALNAQITRTGAAVPELDAITEQLRQLCANSGRGVTLISGHRGAEPDYQALSAIMTTAADGTVRPQPTEHFGFADGISDPVFVGQYPHTKEAVAVVGNGKIMPDQSWQPLATGEFLLGHPDEAQEIAGLPMPLDFSRNGTFMACRKLHQNVVAFRRYLERTALDFAAIMEISPEEARDTLTAKMSGRWPDGVPLIAAGSFAEWQAFRQRRADAARANDQATLAAMDRALSEFMYRGDPAGARCPAAAHTRRVNPRDMLDPRFSSPDPKQWNGSVLNNRRRILRRGLPYGSVAPDAADDSGEHGIVMLVVCASLFRQFEFVTQQWLQYGLDSSVGNDTCPMLGNHGSEAKFVIPADPAGGKPPFICDRLPQFVQTRGGDYFFVPSMTALRMIGTGIIDPT